MPPRKKPNSSSSSTSKKPNPQPSKFGIQHFFERHTQNNALLASQKLQANNATPNGSHSVAKPVSDGLRAGTSDLGSSTVVQEIPHPASRKPNGGEGNSNNNDNDNNNSNNPPSQNSPAENSVLPGTDAMEESISELSPEISKSLSLKRFKFSPGMVNTFILWFDCVSHLE